MSWIGGLIKKVNPQEIFNTTAKGLDNLAFTQQEKAENYKELWSAQIEFAKAQANANTISSKARRSLAFMVAWPFLSGKVAAMILVLSGEFEKARAMNEVVVGLAVYFGGVMTFYFGTYLYQKVAGTGERKKKNKD